MSGDVKSSGGTLAIMDTTYKSICKGPTSIFGQIAAAGYNPHDYISAYNLRSYDRVPDPAVVSDMVTRSGLTWAEVQAALARIYIGNQPNAQEMLNNSTIKIHATSEGESLNQEKTKSTEEPFIQVKVPQSIPEARDVLQKWRNAFPAGQSPTNSVSHCCMLGGDLMREPVFRNEIDEKQAYITEEKWVFVKYGPK